jgi:thiamine kinase-like enzyme
LTNSIRSLEESVNTEEVAALGEVRMAEQIAALQEAVPFLRGRQLGWKQLFGGLAHVTFAVTVEDGSRYVVKFLTQEMDDFGLMIPIPDLIANTVAAGESGVGARVVLSLPELPAIVLEYIDGKTLTTAELSDPGYIPRIGRSIRELHDNAPPMANTIDIFGFLDDYLGLVSKFEMKTPEGLLEYLPVMRRIQEALAVNARPLVPSNNDLLAKNIMDDGRVRLIDYDFSGLNDPMFDVGDLAMEGDYDAAQVATVCEAYWGWHDPVQYARARLFGMSAQYTWALLFIGMDRLLSDSPDQSFDYWQEGVNRWAWTRKKLDDPNLAAIIRAAVSESDFSAKGTI